MAKLFTKIADNINGLSQVYSDSTTTSTVLNSIRDFASATPVDEGLVNNDVYRIEPVYYLYNGQWTPSKTEAKFTTNQLQLGTTVQRKRLSDFYNWLPSSNSLIQQKNNGRAENGTLVEIKPYGKGVEDTDRMKQNSAQIPIVSGPRDEKRLFNYFKTNPGLLFLALQQTLQGGNTFKQTRKYDPTSVLTTAANYTLATLTNPLTRITRAMDINTDNAGRLQQETVVSAQSALRLKYVGGQQKGSSRTSVLGRTINTATSRFVQDLLNRTNINVFGNKINLGQLGRTINNVAQTINSLTRSANASDASLTTNQTAYDSLIQNNLWPLVKEYGTTNRNYFNEKDAYLKNAQDNVSKIVNKTGKLHNNYFTAPYPDDDYRSSATYTDDLRSNKQRIGESNGVTSAKYVKDVMNYADSAGTREVTIPKDLDGVHQTEDFITFKIVVPTVFDGGISFRAFVKDIKHDAKGDFEEQRYVGRPERFIVYKGMNRSITFTLYLVAFSKNELSGMWTRVNMLNKLVYPINSIAGYMTPPIVRMTLGNILNEQPGYITDITMNLTDSPWDIDNEITNVVELNITYNIIEKNYTTQDDDTTNLFAEFPLSAKRVTQELTSNRKQLPKVQPIPNKEKLPQVEIVKPRATSTTTTDSQVTQNQYGQMQYVPSEG